MSRPNPGTKGKKRVHGDSIGGLPGQASIITHGTGGGAGAGGAKSIKGPGTQATIKGKTKGMTGK